VFSTGKEENNFVLFYRFKNQEGRRQGKRGNIGLQNYCSRAISGMEELFSSMEEMATRELRTSDETEFSDRDEISEVLEAQDSHSWEHTVLAKMSTMYG
jgi:hypothetical protein